MIHRLINPSKNSSFFLFGARGTGKSTWIDQEFLLQMPEGSYLYFNLLEDEQEERYLREPSLFEQDILNQSPLPQWVIVDEVQKVPRLLDIIHKLIEKKKLKFALTGSSARKLKLMGSNMLGGRAFEYRLFPFSFLELGDQFDFEQSLNFGFMPATYSFTDVRDKIKYLKSYVSTYVKMEVQLEQLLRNIEPFREFLEIAAQMNGKLINNSKISRDVGVDPKTVQTYYSILEDTYLGFKLPAFHNSLRKSQLITPKFYFFDCGIKRALEGALHAPVVHGTSYYGECFEHFVILEFYKLNSYYETSYKMSYFSTPDGSEIDLILSRRREKIFIEIKSTKKVDESEVRKMEKYTKATGSQGYYLSLDPYPQKINGIHCLPWDQGLRRIFDPPHSRLLVT